MAEFNISSVKTTDPGDIYGILCVGVDNTGTLLDPIAFTTSFTETDPVFTASPAAGVTSQKITNWDTAFGWGNHASAGYQSALGFTPLNRAGDSISATNGSGFIGYPSQSGTPSTPSSGFRFYANASHALSWVGQNGFTRTFDGTANTANRAYTLPNASGTIALEGTLTSLANPTIQNGVYQFAQNTKPTQRAAGVPLVAGDRWYNTSNGTEWFWNGTYWLSPVISATIPVSVTAVGDFPLSTFSATGSSPGVPAWSTLRNAGIFLHSWDYFITLTTADAANKWQVDLNIRPLSLPATLISSITLDTGGISNTHFQLNLNYAFLNPSSLLNRFYLTATKTGSPSNLTFATLINYSNIAN